MWTVHYFNQAVQNWVDAMPAGIRADFARLTELMMEFGADLRLPHSRAMGNGLFELRPKGKEGIARIFYCTQVGKEIVILHGFIKKTEQTARKELAIAIRRMKEVKNVRE